MSGDPEDVAGRGEGSGDQAQGADPPARTPGKSKRKARPTMVRVFLTGTGDRRDAGKVRMFTPERAAQLIRDGHARR